MGWAKSATHSGCGVEVAVGMGVEVGTSVGVSVGASEALGAMVGGADGATFVSMGEAVQAVNARSKTASRTRSKPKRFLADMFPLPAFFDGTVRFMVCTRSW
jgi:hypothetical protein